MGIESIDGATLAAVLATIVSISCTWPQVARIRRTCDIAGVSITAATLGVSSEIGWTVYLGGEGLWSAVPEGVFNIATDALLALAVVRHGGSYPRGLIAAGVWSAMLLTARGLGGPPALAALLAVAYGVQLTPAIVTAWRTRSPSGISVTMWTMRLVEALLWGAYGLARDDPPLIVYGVLGATASVAILVRKGLTRDRLAADGIVVAGVGAVIARPSQRLEDAVVG